MADLYSTLYKITLALIIDQTTVQLAPSDIVSIAMIHQYDTATYPIIRFRIQTDLSTIQEINENPDNLQIIGNLDASIYKITQSTDSNTTTIVAPATSISLQMKGYLENKNIPTSKIDSYQIGSNTDENALNASKKITFEMYGYNENMIHQMRQHAPSIYRDVSVETVIQDILNRANIHNASIDPIENQKRYDQILIPNLSIIEAFTFFDRFYGLYSHGGLLYGDIDRMYLCNTKSSNNTNTIPIYTHSAKNNSEDCGMFYVDGQYKMQTNAINVSIISETDVERTLNPEIVSDINVYTLDSNYEELTKLFDTTNIDSLINRIDQKNILHKMDRTNVSTQTVARLNEQVTRIDLSGAGFDVGLFHPNSRFNIIFETPARGLNISDAYRAKYICHVFSNYSANLFQATTTMQLCTN